jgi:hypothetical protein
VWFRAAYGAPPGGFPLEEIFAIMVCRIEDAVAQRARDPIDSVSNCGSPGSRLATKTMLMQLGFTAAQARIAQRLMGGSSGGWPGLLRLYLAGTESIDLDQRRYIARQLRAFRANAGAWTAA